MGDSVKHPEHYNDGKIEVWDFIEDKKLGFNTGNAIKYICRAGKKDPTKTVEDLKKAVEYLNKEIEIKKDTEFLNSIFSNISHPETTTYIGSTPKCSGRYPWGENDPKEAKRWLDNVNTLIHNGWSEVDIAKVHGLTTIGFRDRIRKYREVINQHDKDVAVKNDLFICTEKDDYFMWNILRWSTIFAYYKLPILPSCKIFITFIGHKEYIVSNNDYSDEFYNKTIVLNVNFDNGTFTLEDDPYKTHFDIPKFALPECKYEKLVELLHDQNALDHIDLLTVGNILDIIDFCNAVDKLRSDKFTDTYIANLMGFSSVILLRSMLDKCYKIKREVRKLL